MTSVLCLTAFLIAVSSPIAAMAAGTDVTVHVTSIKDQKGEVFAALYDKAGWSGEHPLAAAHVAVTGPDVTLHLAAPGPGRYGIKLFQSLDGKDKLATNFLGIPSEPYAFSNNATGHMGPPDFDGAAFDAGADGAKQDISFK